VFDARRLMWVVKAGRPSSQLQHRFLGSQFYGVTTRLVPQLFDTLARQLFQRRFSFVKSLLSHLEIVQDVTESD
jgi:hypothetical protein